MPKQSRIDLVDALTKTAQKSEYNKTEVGSFKNYFKPVAKTKKRGRPKKKVIDKHCKKKNVSKNHRRQKRSRL